MPTQPDRIDTLLAALRELPLWTHLEARATADQQANVKKLLVDADALLARVVETFPTYTLHNRTHAINVASLMGRLVEPWLAEMHALEAALLLLSAFWHDVGMVFDDEERATIAETEEFAQFLHDHPEARLEFAEEGCLSQAVAEWFCRWNHAERVFHHLNAVDDELLEWDGVLLRQQLGDLCRSHGRGAAELKDDDTFPTDFLGVADVRFCAILLRLADILDFDRSRSPEAIYRYLRINRREDGRQKASDVEWRKHLVSSGFHFPEPSDSRRVPYPLKFIASPDEPAVEWDARQFLDVVEGEILVCQQVLRACSPRWRDMALPSRIDREFRSRDYKFGDYRFLLDQEQVLGLLMGESLYANPYVFVRELLQNALDTSRHREFHERATGNAAFRCEPIVVSEWYDHEQYRWVRFDDFGMGMTEEIVRNFLLRVGRSYYNSAEFKAEQLQYRAQNGFTPISRFGIGLLACFIVGDRVEISTRHAVQGKTRSDSVRLSLSGLHGFFTLQTGTHKARPMPGQHGDETAYRAKAGTSIAVRLDPRKEREFFDLEKTLERYLVYPPVQVQFKDRAMGGDPSLLQRPLLEEAIEEQLDEGQIQPFLRDLGMSPETKVTIRVIPVDLTSHSPTDKLLGQLIRLSLDVRSPADEIESQAGVRRKYALSLSIDRLLVTSEVDFWSFDPSTDDEGIRVAEYRARIEELTQGEKTTTHVDLSPLWGRIPGTARAMLAAPSPVGIQLAHNGIAVVERGENKIFEKNTDLMRTAGAIVLLDELRPEISVSRDSLNGLPWNVCAALELAHRRATAATEFPPRQLLHHAFPPERETFAGRINSEPLLSREGPWAGEALFTTMAGEGRDRTHSEMIASLFGRNKVHKRLLSATALQQEATRTDEGITISGRSVFFGRGSWDTSEMVRRLLLQRDFRSEAYLYEIRVASLPLVLEMLNLSETRTSPFSKGEMLFPPLTFVRYANVDGLRHPQLPMLNARHPFAEWLLGIAPKLEADYPGFLNSIREQCLRIFKVSDSETWLSELNALMDRLRGLNRAVAPPAALRLTPDDLVTNLEVLEWREP